MFSIDIDGIGTVCAFSVLNIKEYIKIRDKVKEIYNKNKNDIAKSHNIDIKFLNSLIYFEKYFSYNDMNINNNLDIIKEKDNEVIVVDEERLFLKDKGNKKNDNNSNNECETKMINIISEIILNDYKGKIDINEIKENISYFLNVDKKINFDEIIQHLYEKKCSFTKV